MQKQSRLPVTLLPYLLLAPQLADHVRLLLLAGDPGGVAVVPAAGRVRAVDHFVWFENYRDAVQPARLLTAPSSAPSCSPALVALLSLSIALLLAVMADKPLRGSAVYRTLLIWPYAVAPAVAGVLWVFMFQAVARHRRARTARAAASTGIRCSTAITR